MKELAWDPGALQEFTAFCKALVTPDIDESLDEEEREGRILEGVPEPGRLVPRRAALLASVSPRTAAPRDGCTASRPPYPRLTGGGVT